MRRPVTLALASLLVLPALASATRPPRKSAIAVRLEPVATGLAAPIGLIAPGDGSGHLFLVEQAGRIRILEGGALRAEPFLDIHQLVPCDADYCDERGL